eukprot:gene22495-biopygen31165
MQDTKDPVLVGDVRHPAMAQQQWRLERAAIPSAMRWRGPWGRPWPQAEFYDTELACLLAVTRSKAVKPHIWPSQPQPPAPATSPQPLQHVPPSPLRPSSATSPPLAPCRQLDTDLRLAAMSKDTDGLDIHSDQFALEYLRRGVLGINSLVKTCKICDQAMAYFNQPTATLQSHPIHGLFFAWGIDLSGPYNKTARGNTMLMHAVEYFSAALVVVPIPAKEAIHTVYTHSHGVLAHFGAYALCITDNGPEFQGKFKEHLLHNFIDHRTVHPNHPQGNGFVERSVGTIKAALTKICSEHLATDTWDIDIAKVVTAYNCSPQETTKCAPFTLLYARAPVMNNPEAQLAMTAQLPDLKDNTQVQALTDTLLERAQWIKRVSPTIANHIAIAHHRDTLRYANIKGGAYNPRLRKFQVGNFVYIRRPNVRNSLQMAAQGMILRIIDLKPTEVVVLQGPYVYLQTLYLTSQGSIDIKELEALLLISRLLYDGCGAGYHTHCLDPPLSAVPVEDWFCPNCKASGITAIPAGRTPEAPQKEPNLFPTPQTRSRDRAAQACDKMLVIKQVRVQGGLDKAVWGTASFQGPLSRPWHPTHTILASEDNPSCGVYHT